MYKQALSHDIRELMRERHMENTNFTKGDLLTNEVDVDLDVLGPAVMMDGVCCHVYSTTLSQKTTVAEGSGRWSS